MTVHCTLLGGGFGRKSKCDFAIEAALLVEGDGRRAGKGRVDARGRHPARLLPHRHGRSLRGGPRRQQQGDRVASSQRRADLHGELRARSEASERDRARHGMGRYAVQRAEHPDGERRGAGHTRIGWFRSVNNVMHAWSTQSFVAELAPQLGRDPKDFLLELIGPARIVDPRKQVTTRGGTMASRSRPIRSTPDGCAASPSLRPRRPAGAASCRRAGALASPPTAAS